MNILEQIKLIFRVKIQHSRLIYMYIIHVGDILSYIILFVHAAAIFGKYQISNNMVPPPPHFDQQSINFTGPKIVILKPKKKKYKIDLHFATMVPSAR